MATEDAQPLHGGPLIRVGQTRPFDTSGKCFSLGRDHAGCACVLLGAIRRDQLTEIRCAAYDSAALTGASTFGTSRKLASAGQVLGHKKPWLKYWIKSIG